MTFDVHQLDLFLLVGSAVTILAILAVRISSRAGLPSLLIYLLMGVVLGESGVGIEFENADVAQALGFAALAVILAEGGLTTKWRDVRPSMRLGLSLATIGVAVSVTVMAVAAHYLLGLPWELAVLLGAVTSPTDAAAVFSVLRVVPISKRLVRRARGGVGPQRRPDGRARHPDLHRGARRARRLRHGGIVVYELVVGVGVGSARRLRRRVADAPRGPAGVRASTPSRCSRWPSSPTAPRPSCTRPGSRRCTSPR